MLSNDVNEKIIFHSTKKWNQEYVFTSFFSISMCDVQTSSECLDSLLN